MRPRGRRLGRPPAPNVRTVLALALAAVSLAACSDAAPGGEADPGLEAPPVRAAALPTEELPYFVLGSLGGGSVSPRRPFPTPGDSAARRAYAEEMRAVLDRYRALSAAVTGAADWREADAAVRRAVAPDSLVPHGAAVAMLDRHLLRGPLDDPDRVEALGRYTQALLSNRSAEGALLLWALLRLEGRWEDGRRRSAARAAADRLGGAFAEVAGCVGCTVEEALAGMWPEQRRSAEDRLYEMRTVHEQLMRIAQGGTPMPG